MIAVLTAAKAVIKALLVVHVERWRFLVVEGTAGRPLSSLALQLNARADNIRQIEPITESSPSPPATMSVPLPPRTVALSAPPSTVSASPPPSSAAASAPLEQATFGPNAGTLRPRDD